MDHRLCVILIIQTERRVGVRDLEDLPSVPGPESDRGEGPVPGR